MAIRAVLLSCESIFLPGAVAARATVQLVDDVFGVMGSRHVDLTDPAILAGVQAAALALLPATEVSLGVPITLPAAPAPPSVA